MSIDPKSLARTPGTAREVPTICLDSRPREHLPENPPSLYFSPNVIEDNRERARRGLPIVQRGYWPGDAKIGLGPTGERLEAEQERRKAGAK